MDILFICWFSSSSLVLFICLKINHLLKEEEVWRHECGHSTWPGVHTSVFIPKMHLFGKDCFDLHLVLFAFDQFGLSILFLLQPQNNKISQMMNCCLYAVPAEQWIWIVQHWRFDMFITWSIWLISGTSLHHMLHLKFCSVVCFHTMWL